MKYKRSDIFLLLSILVLFSASVGILHGRKKGGSSYSNAGNGIGTATGLTEAEALAYVQPLLYAHSIHTAAELIQKMPTGKLKSVLQKIISDKESPLVDQEKIGLLSAVVYLQISEKKNLGSILSIMDSYVQATDINSVLFYIAQSDYAKILKEYAAFLRREGKSDRLGKLVDTSFETAIVENDIHAIETLYSNGLNVGKKRASELLWYAVRRGVDPTFVAFLVRRAGADPNYHQQGRTVLIKAVQERDKRMVQVLLEYGADPQIIIDPAVGSAKQIAFERGYTDVEILLDEDLAP